MANTKSNKKTTKETSEIKEPGKIIPKDIDPNQTVVVRNGFHGLLVYKSSKTGEKFVWPEFGSEQEMELSELRNAKNSSKGFFTNNWFMFDDKWVIDYLGVGQYYKYTIDIDHFDDIFKKAPSEIKKIISDMSVGQRKSIAYRAIELIKSGDIDSRKTITALEEALGIELIEK